jgi:hypothetical protein
MQEQARNIFTTNSQVLPAIKNICGHISIGKRKYNIAIASDLPSEQRADEICRFDLDGRTLVVAETGGDRRRKVSTGSSDEIGTRLTGREVEIAVLVAQGLLQRI